MDNRFTPQPENIPPALQGIEDLGAPRSFFCDDCKDYTQPDGLIDISPFGNPRFNDEGSLAVRFNCGRCGKRKDDRVRPWGLLISILMLCGFGWVWAVSSSSPGGGKCGSTSVTATASFCWVFFWERLRSGSWYSSSCSSSALPHITSRPGGIAIAPPSCGSSWPRRAGWPLNPVEPNSEPGLPGRKLAWLVGLVG